MTDLERTKTLRDFIETEIANSDDKYALSVEETQQVFAQAIKATEEVTGKDVDIDRFKEFLTYYKIMKVVEQVTETIRSEKYFAACKEQAEKFKKYGG